MCLPPNFGSSLLLSVILLSSMVVELGIVLGGGGGGGNGEGGGVFILLCGINLGVYAEYSEKESAINTQIDQYLAFLTNIYMIIMCKHDDIVLLFIG